LFVIVLVVSIDARAPLLHADYEEKINSEYIVVFHPSYDPLLAQIHIKTVKSNMYWNEVTDSILYEYNFNDFVGYAVRIANVELLDTIRDLPEVQYVQQNLPVWAAQSVPCATQAPNIVEPWGRKRISTTVKSSYDLNYVYPAAAGKGVYAYIIDTGIYLTHVEFTGRIIDGYNAVKPGTSANDDNGHGTHVAGTVGGTKYGIAKEVTLIAIKVLSASGSGTTAGVVAGINHAANDAAKRALGKSVINKSLGGPADTTIDNAVRAAIAGGVTIVVAAGNDNANAANYSPARVTQAITVGALQKTMDARSSYSNWGTPLDVFAPGDNILSAWIGSTTATNTISGTSMASPHVCGIVSFYLSLNSAAKPADVEKWVHEHASQPINVSNKGTGSPSRIAFHGYPECKAN